MTKRGDLGAYLSARRAAVTPQDVGIVAETGRRRVAGLRREELAAMAGVSVDYYARLEQGRERNPSAGVLNALARVLRLDVHGREHLFRLADVPFHAAPAGSVATASPELRALLDSWPDTPAMILNERLDVLAANRLAEALYSPFRAFDNLVRMTFLDPVAPTFFVDWHRAAEACAANLRTAVAGNGTDSEIGRLVEELHAAVEFRRYWRRHEVRGKTAEAKEFLHPQVGSLTLGFQAFDVRSAPGAQLVVYSAEPASPSADALRLLGAIAATTATLS
ncbi:helix-turn-helix domain-containing protein [Actinoalloteichus sp. GBA129-24]|uniref:helix-turn-helix domain-containing protein n=1 Tax=Actinoalloteichus sp. GBA129-24 TaxID=1612551 RepID=UPI0009503EDC|nr:helix-turn-helix transcriptional regulator [Actinoalloteichus sp. GBA129-24]APU21563.1 putative transcriptional regulator [Actinoalloteichus sp. GBA129-24]